eukprot:118937_1
MPNIEMMDKECCKSIVQDIKNVTNIGVAIQFRWISSEPDQLIKIKTLIDQHAKGNSSVWEEQKTIIPIDNHNEHNNINTHKKHKRQLTLGLSSIIDEEEKYNES